MQPDFFYSIFFPKTKRFFTRSMGNVCENIFNNVPSLLRFPDFQTKVRLKCDQEYFKYSLFLHHNYIWLQLCNFLTFFNRWFTISLSLSTVKGYARAGFAGIMLEDQVSPKRCGHAQPFQWNNGISTTKSTMPYAKWIIRWKKFSSSSRKVIGCESNVFLVWMESSFPRFIPPVISNQKLFHS